MITRDGLEYTIDFTTKIGTGAYGNVHPGRTQSGRHVAVKRARDEKEIQAARREVEFYRRCVGSPNIVKYIGSEHKMATNHSPERFSFAMERALFSLDKLMKQVRNLRGVSKEITIDLLCDSVSALTTLKERGIAHRDIKHLNILVFPGLRKGRRSKYLFKFCDMGVSSFVHEDGVMQTLVGTPNALCPELALAYAQRQRRTNDNYTREQCDLWSFGCTLYFVATGMFPFPIDAKDSNVYAQAVAEQSRPQGAISAERLSGDTNRYMYKYGYKLENTIYPKWFRHCLTKVIALLFSRERTLEALAAMVNVLRESVERRFMSIESMDIYSYCDLSAVSVFSDGYPSLRQELGLKPGAEYRLIYESHLAVFTNTCQDVAEGHQAPPILFPLLADIPWAPKQWGFSVDIQGDKHEHDENAAHVIRTSVFAQAGEALRDCEKIVQIVETSRHTLRTQLEKLRIELESVREKTLMPVRFTIYAKMHSFALMPFVESETDKVIMDRICEVADAAAKALENCTEFINQSLIIATQHIDELNAVEIDSEEEPGLEDELNFLLNEDYSGGISEYEKELANRCMSRRADLAALLCNNPQKSIVRVLLRAARFVVDMRIELTKYGNYIDDCIGNIERPFQELKNCMERMQANGNLDERSLRKALQYYKRPLNIIDHTRQIRDKARVLLQLVQQPDDKQS